MVEKVYRLLFLFPGPSYDIEEDFGGRLGLLSNNFTGTVITYSPDGGREKFGRFQIISAKLSDRSSRLSKLYRLFKLIKRNITSSDAVVTYDPLLTGLLGLYFSHKYKKKLIVEVNGLHHLKSTYADKNVVSGFFYRKLYTAIMRLVINRADGVKLLFERQLEGLDVDLKGKITVAYHDYVRLEKFKNLGERKVILCAGFPVYLKGIDLLVAAFKRLSPRFPEWELHIVGWFEYPEILHELIDGHNKIFVLPPVPHRLMPEIMGNCSIFAMPSRSEGMGRVFLEAARCHKARIGSNTGGIPSVISDNVDGFLVRSEDIDDLVDKLYLLISSPEIRERFAHMAYMRSLSEFSEEKYLAKTRTFYYDVINQ